MTSPHVGQLDAKRAQLLKRAGIDPIRLKVGSISTLIEDHIPEAKWQRQLALLRRMGYDSYQSLLLARKKSK